MILFALAAARGITQPADWAVTVRGADPPMAEVDADRRDEACLRDVHFVDADYGWAVGDLGVIIHTADGGENWHHQNSGTTCSLYSVHFSTSRRGIAVGGWYEADTGLSRGVLLSTTDGGHTWDSISNWLPLIDSVYRYPNGTLVAAGEWSPFYLGRIFHSTDDGHNWRAVDGELSSPPMALSIDQGSVVLVDRQGTVSGAAIAGDPMCTVANLPGVTAVSASGSTWAASVADGALAFSHNGGRTWSTVGAANLDIRDDPPGLPMAHSASAGGEEAVIHGFQILCFNIAPDGHLWCAGTPGDRVIRVGPTGKVETFATGASLPIESLFFLDQHRGWAVGGYGMILATRDGGRTWRPQRDEQKRAMVLGVARAPAALPWPLLASESLEYGRRVAVAVTPNANAADPLVGDSLRRTVAAASRVGGGDVVPWLETQPSGSAEAILAGYRPRVVVLGADLASEERQVWMAAAVRMDVARVYEVTDADRADLTIHSSAVLPNAGALTGDLWADALSAVAAGSPLPETMCLRRVLDQSDLTASTAGVSEGLATSGARRRVPEGRRRNLQILQARSGERALIERLVRHSDHKDDATLRRNLELLVDQSPLENRERLIRAVLHHCHSARDAGSSPIRLYVIALRVAANRPDSALSRWAILRLSAIDQSFEWQQLLADCTITADPGPTRTQDDVAVHRSPFERDLPRVMPASATTPIVVVPQMPAPPNRAPADGTEQRVGSDSADDLTWGMHPAVLLWHAKGGLEGMEAWDREALHRLGAAGSSGPWRALVVPDPDREILAAPVSVARGSATPRPLLDGVLDDACWKYMRDLPAEDDGHRDSQIAIAYDSEYIYFAARAQFAPRDEERPVQQRRERDAEVKAHPRLVLEIDVDRDLLTTFELAVDVYGRTRDTCDGFVNWQPRWYVATAFHEGRRTVEAAIRRSDLANLPPAASDRWRVRMRIRDGGESPQWPTFIDPTGWRDVVFR